MRGENNPELRQHVAASRELPLFEESGLSSNRPPAAQCETAVNQRRSEDSIRLTADQAHARTSDPETSHAAARSVVNLGRTRDAILGILRAQPKTDEQIWVAYRLAFDQGIPEFPRVSPSGLRSRRAELVKMGRVEQCGEGVTQAGRTCAKWRVTK